MTDRYYMFSEARAFNQDLTRWDMRSVRGTDNMFDGALAMQRDNNPAGLRLEEGVEEEGTSQATD